MKKITLIFSTVVAVVIAGCGGGTTPYAPIITGGGGGGFVLAGGGGVFVNPGSAATFTVQVRNQPAPQPGRSTDPVTLSVEGALPEGTEASFATNPVNVGGQTTLSISTTTGTPVGSYPFTIKGTNSGGTQTIDATLHVNGGDFIVTLTPASRTMDNGGGGGAGAPGDPFVEYTVSVVKENDVLVGPVDLSFVWNTTEPTSNGQPIFETQITPAVLNFTASDTGPKTATVRLTRIRTSNVTGTFQFLARAHLLTITKPDSGTIILTGNQDTRP